MSVKSFLAKIIAFYTRKKIDKWAKNPIATQEKVFLSLIKNAQNTKFGVEHHFSQIRTHQDFVERVPIRDYEQFKAYIDAIQQGEENILWRGKPIYFAKTSGTTSGVKYIPITKESMPYHITAARDAILCYINETQNAAFINGKMIFLQGSPVLEQKNGIKIGRLSGISAHFVPKYLQKNRLPSWQTNCIEDWEQKVDAIVEETFSQNMTLISGIPSWVQMYFEKLVERSKISVGKLFENFQLFIYGGVNYQPYKARFEYLIGRKVDSIELFPASEGFFAYQDSQTEKGMLLLLDGGIFYEFVKAEDFTKKNPKRLSIKEVELGVNYAMIISTNAGLWAYNIGDTIQFVSKSPYRIIVSGRIKHFISAFGEHIIAQEVEQALFEATQNTSIQINEFTVAPQVNPKEGELPYHEWFIEFEEIPTQIEKLAYDIDQSIQKQNIYYHDLRKGNILQNLKITPVKKGSFNNYMKSIGKFGGQNKTPHLSNDRTICEALIKQE